MIDLGFIFPSSEYLFDPFRGDPHTHLQILTVIDARLGEQVHSRLIDLRGVKREFAGYHIPECDVYLHSVYTLDIEEQKDIVAFIRRRYPSAKHIAGGPHVHEFREESLQIFDSLILGDGEEVIVEALKDFQNNVLKKTYEQRRPVKLEDYPFPRRHYLSESTVARKNMMNLKGDPKYDELLGSTAIFSRGCPGNCHFCAMPDIRRYNPGLRFRSPESVEAEINYLKSEYDIRVLSFLDEIGIPPNRHRAIPFLEAVGRTGIYWRGQCRADGLEKDVIELAYQSGCRAMGIGIESVWQKSLDIINKQIDLEQARKTIENLRAAGIETRIYLILGVPGEPQDIEERTWQFIQEMHPNLVILSLFTIRPGTTLFREPARFGIKWISDDWQKTMHMQSRYGDERPSLNFEYEEMTPFGPARSSEQIVQGYLDLQQRIKTGGFGSTIYNTSEYQPKGPA